MDAQPVCAAVPPRHFGELGMTGLGMGATNGGPSIVAGGGAPHSHDEAHEPHSPHASQWR
jgi:hypothetical protein